MLPRDLFVAGLASFLLGHVAYVVGLATVHESWTWFALGAAAALVAVSIIGPRILAGVGRADPSLRAPVVGYMAVISAMVMTAWATTRALAVTGAMLFYASDAVLAWNRFVHEQRWGRLTVMVTYHLGQIGLVLSLA
ncbi:MAG: lysoplasmalogenase [Acidimicrobiales bacterium]